MHRVSPQEYLLPEIDLLVVSCWRAPSLLSWRHVAPRCSPSVLASTFLARRAAGGRQYAPLRDALHPQQHDVAALLPDGRRRRAGRAQHSTIAHGRTAALTRCERGVLPRTRCAVMCLLCAGAREGARPPQGGGDAAVRGLSTAQRSAMLCYAVLCYAVLCCAVLCCAVLCCAVLCCAVLCLVTSANWFSPTPSR